MDDPMMMVIIGVAVVALIALVIIKRKQDAGGKSTKNNKNKQQEATSQTENKPVADNDDWDWGVSSHVVDDTKVSVNDVDALTEFNVYKQFGYYDKAAESLKAYLEKTQKADATTVKELADLWLEAKKTDSLAEVLMQYQSFFNEEEMTEYIKAGLALDENHLGLRVLAESRLGWSVKKTAEEIGEKSIADAPARPEKESKPRLGKNRHAHAEAAQELRQLLVTGTGRIEDLSNDEKGAVLAFMKPEKSVKLLRDSLTYDASVKYLNKAIRSSTKPAALLIDALTLDYRANNINGFAGHLWNLYYTLGQYGRQVKERMLGWGYSLGQHPVFERLETNPNDTILREIGMGHGYLDGGSLKKGRYQALVSEKVDVAGEPRTPAERILKEAESLLMYGQLDNSMDVLEAAINEYPQESQLYITLFDLYERAEEWERLENTLQILRTKVQSLPEEVVLAMSQLLQRFNNGSFGQ
ncbi:MAG: hypothetical protein Q4B82_05610 [Alysiella sp.]|uniref:hypothetical protein n=1 Tax=Alysiella sp. TaxID=1872483 RepID=UPI0026DB962B|nr:hypothetical protein [Alysiella sp.]MDO4434042.1 hypothetical protein [Alysiella sp.]